MKPMRMRDLGLIDFEAAVVEQESAWRNVVAATGPAAILLCCQHPPVITLGRSSSARAQPGERPAGVLKEASFLAARGVKVAATSRGGKTTFHGPGQLVVYPIVRLRSLALTVKCFVRALEEAMAETCRVFGVGAAAGSATGLPVGCWVEGRKLGQVGIAVRRGVTLHGLAFNVAPDLEAFGWIDPCGLAGGTFAVSSLARECAAQGNPPPQLERARQLLLASLAKKLGVETAIG